MDNDTEKYRELYNLSKEVLGEELGRFHRIDEKASKYLSVLTLLLGVYGFFGKSVLDSILPPRTLLSGALVVLGVVVLFAVLGSWLVVFTVFRQHQIKKMPLTSETLGFFDDNALRDIYYTLAKGNKEALRENRETTDRKSKSLFRAYWMMLITMCLFILFTLLFVIQALTGGG